MGNDAKILDHPVQPQAPIQPSSPIGTPNKEMGPIGGMSEIKRSGENAEHGFDQELAKLGVREIQNKPDLTSLPKEIGVEHSGNDIQAPLSPTGLVQIPEQGNVQDSNTWLKTVETKVRDKLKIFGL